MILTFGANTIYLFFNFSIIPLLFLLFLFQKIHYGVKFLDRIFFAFYFLYNFYILLYLTILRRYPIESMLGVPQSISSYLYGLTISISLLLCAPTIYYHFSIKKFVFLSLFVCTIPSVIFINYIGLDLIQAGFNAEEESFLQTLSISYSNIYLFVFAILFFKKMLKSKWTSYIFSTAIIFAVLYILFAYGKRGPMLWSIVIVMVCLYIKSRNKKTYILLLGILSISIFLLIDPILEGIKDTMPRTGRQLERSIKYGDTAQRFDLKDPKHSNYLIGLENFSRSPILGYYFREVSDDNEFKGMYPHNLFIEILMTMGLIGFFLLVMILIKAYRKSNKTLNRKYRCKQMAILILFLCPFFQLQTSNTVLFKHDFWLFCYMLCCLDILDKTDKGSTSLRGI